MVNGVKLFFAISKFGAPGEIRTPDQPVRSRLLYPTELRRRIRERLFYQRITNSSIGW